MLTTTTLRLRSSTPMYSHARARAAVSNVAEEGTSHHRGRRSLYEVLRVKQDASQVEIKTAYRTLAKLYHPDAKSRFVENTEAAYHHDDNDDGESSTDDRDFIEIRQAYGTLSDPDARAVYDCTLLNKRPWRSVVGSGQGIRTYPTRRWETDQCW